MTGDATDPRPLFSIWFALDRSTLAAGESADQPFKEAETMKALRKLAALTLSLAATPCLAGIADSPLPVLSVGVDTLHLYSVPGVIRSGSLGTFLLLHVDRHGDDAGRRRGLRSRWRCPGQRCCGDLAQRRAWCDRDLRK